MRMTKRQATTTLQSKRATELLCLHRSWVGWKDINRDHSSVNNCPLRFDGRGSLHLNCVVDGGGERGSDQTRNGPNYFIICNSKLPKRSQTE